MTMKQQTLTGFEKYGKTTRRAKFLADMDRIIPWPEMTAAVATVYPKINEQGGRPPDTAGAGAADLLSAAAVQPLGSAG
jgi:hypothetical protein